MSDLKYKDVDQLKREKAHCLEYIGRLKSQLNGQKVRLEWIDKYLYEKSPQELTIQQIEQRLGHKVIISAE